MSDYNHVVVLFLASIYKPLSVQEIPLMVDVGPASQY